MVFLFTCVGYGLGIKAASAGSYSAGLEHMCLVPLSLALWLVGFWHLECVSRAKFRPRCNWVSRDMCIPCPCCLCPMSKVGQVLLDTEESVT